MNEEYGSLAERRLKECQKIYQELHKEEIEEERIREMKREREREKQRKRGKIKESCIGIAVALVSLSALSLLLFSKETAMVSFIVGVIIPLVVGLCFCAWTLAKNAANSLTKTIILTILIIGAMIGGIYLLSNAHWGNKPRMEQIDSQRPDKY